VHAFNLSEYPRLQQLVEERSTSNNVFFRSANGIPFRDSYEGFTESEASGFGIPAAKTRDSYPFYRSNAPQIIDDTFGARQSAVRPATTEGEKETRESRFPDDGFTAEPVSSRYGRIQ
jgi:hypothetical protein